MASRMERYYKNASNEGRRSRKNEELYRTIYEGTEYYNIEGVATMDKTNEIDLSKIQEMLKNRENYQRQSKYRRLFHKEEPKKEVKPVVEEVEEEDRNYDIRDILTKAKEENSEEIKNDYHSLNNTQYNILKNLQMKEKVKKEDYIDEEDPEIKKLINTITNTSMLNKLGDKELSLDLLNDLKADTITSVGTLPSIQDIMEEEPEEKEPTGEMDLDKSFFTSAYSFGKDDFEFDENGEVIPKKKHTGLKIVIIILVILILACIGVGVYFLIK